MMFGILSLGLNVHISKEVGYFPDLGNVQTFLMDSFTTISLSQAGLNYATEKETGEEEGDSDHTLAGLSCEKYGGPSEKAAREMVYWQDIPSDSHHVSPFKRKDGPTQYLTFEPDAGGW